MLNIKKHISSDLKKLSEVDFDPKVEEPQDFSHGDYSSNIALVLSKQVKKNPMELAEELAEKFKSHLQNGGEAAPYIDKIEAVRPGFINFWLSEKYLLENLQKIQDTKTTTSDKLKNQKILVEFAHPNTHKEFHIGHLRNITLGEAIIRLLKASGAEVFRANYQGDIGMHIAKCVWGILNSDLKSELEKVESASPREKAEFLGKAYVEGSKAFEEDASAKEEIVKINKQIYAKDPSVVSLWEKTRQWSLDYFDSIYKRVGTHFDRLYFESQAYEKGKEIVLSHVKDGIFTESDGAIIFDGEKYGLHKRVFITSEGNPTYEAKDIGLAPLQYKEFPFDLAIHIVGPEQAEYFKVVFQALELIDPAFKGKEKHLPYGFVRLKEGKMSSRLGKVIAGVWLLDEAKKRIREGFKEMDDETAEKVAVGAVKYSMLKFAKDSDIQFSFEESISLEGNSGPYIQYTYVRTKSVLAKKAMVGGNNFTVSSLEPEELQLLRVLAKFNDVIEESSTNFAPNLLCNYLFLLAQTFNLFYQKHKILGSETEDFRLSLVSAISGILSSGLYLLGIESPEKM